MESRKVQKVGAATLTVSLPKAWVERRNIKKGDQVFLAEEGNALRLLSGPDAEERHRESKEFLIDADLSIEPGMLERVIVGNYVLGRERLIVRSKQRLGTDHQDELRSAVHRLMGIGIIEESPSKVVLQASVDPTNYPLDALLKRLYILGSMMMSESLEALATGNPQLAEDARKREDDADMMYWLILRLLLSAQMDEALVDVLGMRSRLEIAGNRAIAGDLERVADHCLDIATTVSGILGEGFGVPGGVTKALQGLAAAIGEVYTKALGGLLSRDVTQANEALRLNSALRRREQDLLRLLHREVRSVRAIVPLHRIYTNLVQIGDYARSIALIAFNRYLEKPTNLCRPAKAD